MFSIVYDNSIAVSSIFDDIPRDWFVVDCRPLIDGPGNAEELVQNLLTIGLEQLRSGKKVCFACDYGHSRSNYMAALAISRVGSVSITDAISIVEVNHPESSVKPTLLQSSGQDTEHSLRRQAFAITGSNTSLAKLLTDEIRNHSNGYTVVNIDDCLGSGSKRKLLEKALSHNQITDVVHCAYPSPRNSFDSSKKSYLVLIDIIEACLESNATLHYFSTWSVFEGSSDLEIKEDSQPSPFSLYSQAKCLHEEQLRYVAYSGGLAYRVYRTPCLLSRGPNHPRFLMYMADSAAMGRDIYIHKYINGYPVVPMMEASNAASMALQQILAPLKQDSILHICKNQSSLSVAELGRRIAHKYNVKVIETPVDRIAMTGIFGTRYSSKLSQAISCPEQCFNPMAYMDDLIREKQIALQGY
jgi:dTDP-4-dehydrorhamnose reductase